VEHCAQPFCLITSFKPGFLQLMYSVSPDPFPIFFPPFRECKGKKAFLISKLLFAFNLAASEGLT
ncbi:hypothetical protein, partial [Mucilaginibacter polytrichastri]